MSCYIITVMSYDTISVINMSQGLAGGLSPSTPIRIQLPGSNFTLTVPGILASQLATSQALAAAAASQHLQESRESQKNSSQESLGM